MPMNFKQDGRHDKLSALLLYIRRKEQKMNQYLIMCRSLTRAQSSKTLLERNGFTVSVTKAPQKLSQNGCGYALSIYRKTAEAVSLLRERNMLNGKVFRREDDGSYTEVTA